MELQQYDKSSEACDNGLYWNASSPEILFNKGQIMVCFGKYEEAIEFYEKALQFQR
ncbi:MAG: tetratricopeptide repeat protein [Hungatella sp.]|nr:tetratricopeptide repeat protein [Hungatella sp.]